MTPLSSLLALPHLRDDLERVEDLLNRSVEAESPFLSEVARHLLQAGGKRLRPVLALAAGELGGSRAPEAVVRGAAAVELVHLGSLYHDDVMDEADTRRSVPTVNARWGNLVAILGGDYLLARASELAASLGSEVSGLLAATIGHLCEGQLHELQHAFDVQRTEDAYFSAIGAKTASLMSASCRIGALTAELPDERVAAYTAYGRNVGLVFQIVDDVLDLIATSEELGKPAGNDLAGGIYTLPVIRALAQADASSELRALLGRRLGAAEVDLARELVRTNGAVGAACMVASGYAKEASEALTPLGNGPVVDALRDLAHGLVASVAA